MTTSTHTSHPRMAIQRRQAQQGGMMAGQLSQWRPIFSRHSRHSMQSLSSVAPTAMMPAQSSPWPPYYSSAQQAYQGETCCSCFAAALTDMMPAQSSPVATRKSSSMALGKLLKLACMLRCCCSLMFPSSSTPTMDRGKNIKIKKSQTCGKSDRWNLYSPRGLESTANLKHAHGKKITQGSASQPAAVRVREGARAPPAAASMSGGSTLEDQTRLDQTRLDQTRLVLPRTHV
jgi:hypothetical protein